MCHWCCCACFAASDSDTGIVVVAYVVVGKVNVGVGICVGGGVAGYDCVGVVGGNTVDVLRIAINVDVDDVVFVIAGIVSVGVIAVVAAVLW